MNSNGMPSGLQETRIVPSVHSLLGPKRRHPVGWLFLALSGCMVVSAGIDEYTVFTLGAGRGSGYA
jgi:hypothetical protein